MVGGGPGTRLGGTVESSGSLGPGEGDPDPGATILDIGRAHPAPVGGDDRLDDGQPQTAAPGSAGTGGIGPVETIEDVWEPGLREPDPVVGDVDDHFLFPVRDVDVRPPSTAGCGFGRC